MFRKLKKSLYFPVATYFRFFAKIKLRRWQPRIIVITGSSGKTTTLHFIAAQLDKTARYSFHANSAFGIPFDVLDLERKNLLPQEWIKLFLLAPMRALQKPFAEELYLVEADCDRPGEGSFLAQTLRPEVTLWLSSSRSHTQNFDSLVGQRGIPNVETAIAREFGFFLQYTRKLAMINADSPFIMQQRKRAHSELYEVTKKNHLSKYTVSARGTVFEADGTPYTLPFLVPEDTFYALEMTKKLLQYLQLKQTLSFETVVLPPGRSSIFQGKKDTTLIDSTYNATFDGMKTMLEMFAQFPAEKKWVVLGDMLEQGKEEQEEHEKLAHLLSQMTLMQIVLMGPRVSRFAYPKLRTTVPTVTFEKPKEALDFLSENLRGGEVILFKGARFLEGVIEHLLANKEDVQKLCRREKVWQLRRKQWGL